MTGIMELCDYVHAGGTFDFSPPPLEACSVNPWEPSTNTWLGDKCAGRPFG